MPVPFYYKQPGMYVDYDSLSPEGKKLFDLIQAEEHAILNGKDKKVNEPVKSRLDSKT